MVLDAAGLGSRPTPFRTIGEDRRAPRGASSDFTLSAEYTSLLIHTSAAHCRRIDVRLDSGAVTTILSLPSELAAAARCIFVTVWQAGIREMK
jgi:hypothetical protein